MPTRYRTPDADSARWLGFPFRSGDIVISALPKSGTTWMQMICALLIFQTPELPAPLSTLSPWLDHLVAPRDEVLAQLSAQQHRRFIKTHTPLDGVPTDARATYLVVARHPLDIAVSRYYQSDNIDRKRVRQLAGQPEPARPVPPRPPLSEWLLSWVEHEVPPGEPLSSLPRVMWHLSDAWARRHQRNVALVHYDDLLADLDGRMRWLADTLGISVPARVWRSLVEAATFASMRARAGRLAPDAHGIIKDHSAFFRRGSSGAGRKLLTDDQLARYDRRVTQLAPPDLLTWLHRPREHHSSERPSPPSRTATPALG